VKDSLKHSIWALAIVALACIVPQPASAGALCAVGTGAVFACAGPGVADLSGQGPQSFTNIGVNFVLNDGLAVSFNINETITGNGLGQNTTSAVLRISNLVAADVGLGNINDNIYIFSDVFNPSVAGTAGVGAIGLYGAIPALGVVPAGGVYAASSQAQMNYLFAPVGVGGPGVAPTLSLTTPSTFAIGAPAAPFTFYEWARAPIIGGVVQLVGGLNFQLTSGSEIYMPGSLIVDDNDPDAFNSEAPEPASFGVMGSGLVGLALLVRRRRA
jgi:PEP-CTERM motif